MLAVETERLTKRYGELTAVDNLNIAIEEGEIFGLLGPNGAGKTTTLAKLATLLKPTAGTARVNGYDVKSHASEARRSISIVFQDPSSDDELTGRENLYLHALMLGVPKNERTERIEQVLDLVGLRERQNDIVKKYSGGMRRRLELARGLLHNPRTLFLDEPTLGLDPQTREHIWRYIGNLVESEKVTVNITTHYMEDADRLCKRIAIIDHGTVAALDKPSALKSKLGGDIIQLNVRNPRLDRLKELDYVTTMDRAGNILRLNVKEAGKHLQETLCLVGDTVELRSERQR